METQYEISRKIDEEIAKYPNGQELFRTSPSFNRRITFVAHGGNLYEGIEFILKISDNTMQAFEQQIIRRPLTL